MICQPCADAADLKALVTSPSTRVSHKKCVALEHLDKARSCDCQHRGSNQEADASPFIAPPKDDL